jgi:hypothetical protein
MPDAQSTRSLACRKKTRELVTTGTPEANRHSLRDGFTVSFELSLVTGLCCHHHRAENFCAT